MAKITLTADIPGSARDCVTIPDSMVTDPDMTLDTIGLAVVVTRWGGTADLADIAHDLHYGDQCLRTIADSLVDAGYAEITDGEVAA